MILPDRIRCGYGATWVDTGMTMTTPAGPDRPSVTIDSDERRRNRLGAECSSAFLNSLFGGMKSGRRFNSRHRLDVSVRALGRVLQLWGCPLQRLQFPSHLIGPEIEVGAVPGRNAGPQDDRLRGSMSDAYSLGDVAGHRPGVDHIHQIDRHVRMQPPERADFLVGHVTGRADRTVLVDNGQGLREHRGDIRFGSDFTHRKNVAESCWWIYISRIR